MRTVYACVLDVTPNPPELPKDCFHRLVGVLRNWVEQGYERKWAIAVNLVFDGAAFTPAPEHIVRCSDEKAGDCDLVTVEWTHPGDPGSELLWNTTCNLARCEQAIQLSVAVRLASSSPVVRPLSFTVGRPRLVDSLLAAVPCYVGAQPIPKSPSEIAAPEVLDFAETILFSPSRVLPVIVVSPGIWTDRPEVDANELQKSLLGFAAVVALRDKWAGFKLTDCVGKELSCFNGAVRLYWPGLRADSDPFDHPLYLAGAIRWHAENNHPLDRHLFRMLVAISAFRFSDAPVVRRASR